MDQLFTAHWPVSFREGRNKEVEGGEKGKTTEKERAVQRAAMAVDAIAGPARTPREASGARERGRGKEMERLTRRGGGRQRRRPALSRGGDAVAGDVPCGTEASGRCEAKRRKNGSRFQSGPAAAGFVRAKRAAGRRISTHGADQNPKAALGHWAEREGGRSRAPGRTETAAACWAKAADARWTALLFFPCLFCIRITVFGFGFSVLGLGVRV